MAETAFGLAEAELEKESGMNPQGVLDNLRLIALAWAAIAESDDLAKRFAAISTLVVPRIEKSFVEAVEAKSKPKVTGLLRWAQEFDVVGKHIFLDHISLAETLKAKVKGRVSLSPAPSGDD